MGLVLALALAACGGESAKSSTDDSNGGSGGTSSTGGSHSTLTNGGDSSTATTNPNFGSPGPVTSGATSSVGAGGSTSGATDTAAASSGGGAGFAGAGGSAGAACEGQDVVGLGDCPTAQGMYFLGDRCGGVSGCVCGGDDCNSGYPDQSSCERANRGCLEACAAQDITFVGSCDPAVAFAFNGIECVGMEGCSCVGDDCAASYPSLEACEAAHATCTERQRSCVDLAAAYSDYVARTDCQDDSDCTVVVGLCAAGHGCAHVVNRHWGTAGIEAFTDAWNAAGCPQVDCDCDVPSAAVCDAGVCVWGD